MSFKNKFIAFLRDESGPTAVEYAIILFLIILTCVVTIRLIGEGAANNMQQTTDAINDVIN